MCEVCLKNLIVKFPFKAILQTTISNRGTSQSRSKWHMCVMEGVMPSLSFGFHL